MGQAIVVRTDYSSGEVRRLAQRAKAAGQARRLLAIAAVLDGSSREEAARLGGMLFGKMTQEFADQGVSGLNRERIEGPETILNDPEKSDAAEPTDGDRGER